MLSEPLITLILLMGCDLVLRLLCPVNPLRLASLDASPFCYAKRGGSTRSRFCLGRLGLRGLIGHLGRGLGG